MLCSNYSKDAWTTVNSVLLLQEWKLLKFIQFKEWYSLLPCLIWKRGGGDRVFNSCKSNKLSSLWSAPPSRELVLRSCWLPVIVLQQNCGVLPSAPPLPYFLKRYRNKGYYISCKINFSNVVQTRRTISEEVCGQQDRFYDEKLGFVQLSTESSRAAMQAGYRISQRNVMNVIPEN